MSVQITDGIRQLYCPRLNSVSKTADYGLRKWLLDDQAFVPESYDSDHSIILDVCDPNRLLECLSKDIDRLSLAAFETVSPNNKPWNKKFLAWQMVQLYYSAFYSAHSTLKICGFGLTQVDKGIFQHLSKRANLYGITFPVMDAGIYCFDYNMSISKVTLYSVPRYNDSHKGLWHRYEDFIRVLRGTHIKTGTHNAECVKIRGEGDGYPLSVFQQLPQVDANQIAEQLEKVQNIINKNGDENFLSHVRNNINYNHQYGIWFPYIGFSAEYEKAENQTLYLDSPMAFSFDSLSDSELVSFYKCCHFIISLNRELLMDLSARHPSNKSFISNGALKLLKLAKQ